MSAPAVVPYSVERYDNEEPIARAERYVAAIPDDGLREAQRIAMDARRDLYGRDVFLDHVYYLLVTRSRALRAAAGDQHAIMEMQLLAEQEAARSAHGRAA